MELWEEAVLPVRDFVTLKAMHFSLLLLRHSYSGREEARYSFMANALPSQRTGFLLGTSFLNDYRLYKKFPLEARFKVIFAMVEEYISYSNCLDLATASLQTLEYMPGG